MFESEMEQFAKAQMDTLSKAKAVAEAEKKLPPEPIKLEPAYAIAMRAKVMRQQTVQLEHSGQFQIRQTFSGDEKTHSDVPVHSLKQLLIKDLSVRKVHKGHYLLCRVVTSPWSTVSVMFAAQDQTGAAIMTALYNYPALPASLGLPSQRDWEALLPVGTILLIKEPYVKRPAAGADSALLRVDSPTDIQVVREADPLLRNIKWRNSIMQSPGVPRMSLDSWKIKGNAAMKTKSYLTALSAYSHGLDQHPDDSNVGLLLTNRAQVNLVLERYAAAASDAAEALGKLDQNDTSEASHRLLEKTLHRRAKALYLMRRFDQAKVAYQDLQEIAPTSVEAKEGLVKVNQRLQEQEQGAYDLASMYREALVKRNIRFDVADFVGPVEVKTSPNKGRGLFLTKDAKAGQLLIASKALGVAYASDIVDERMQALLSINFLENRMDTETQHRLNSTLMYSMADQPQLSVLINTLFGGKTSSTVCDLSALVQGREVAGSASQAVDPSLVERVTTYNSFGVPEAVQPSRHSGPPPEKTALNEKDGSALFYTNSLINHQCASNCSTFQLGDVQFVRAVQDLQKGTEISITYTGIDAYETRTKRLQKWLQGAECDCSLCAEQRKESVACRKARAKLLEGVGQNEVLSSPGLSKARVQKVVRECKDRIAKLEATYKTTSTIKIEMFNRYFEMGMTLAIAAHDGALPVSAIDEAIDYWQKALKADGIKINPSKASKNTLPISTMPVGKDHTCPLVILQMCSVLNGVGKRSEAKRWLQAAKWICDTACGPGVFGVKYQRILQEEQLDALL